MEDFAPDTERVKAAAVEIAPITGAEFDRWLERVKREAGAAALRDFAEDLLARVGPVVLHDGSGAVFSNAPKGTSTEFWSYGNAVAYTGAVLEVLDLLNAKPGDLTATTFHNHSPVRRTLDEAIERGE